MDDEEGEGGKWEKSVPTAARLVSPTLEEDELSEACRLCCFSFRLLLIVNPVLSLRRSLPLLEEEGETVAVMLRCLRERGFSFLFLSFREVEPTRLDTSEPV